MKNTTNYQQQQQEQHISQLHQALMSVQPPVRDTATPAATADNNTMSTSSSSTDGGTIATMAAGRTATATTMTTPAAATSTTMMRSMTSASEIRPNFVSGNEYMLSIFDNIDIDEEISNIFND